MEVYMPVEMIEAGEEAMKEARSVGMSDQDAAVLVYLAMQGVLEICLLKSASGSVH